MMDEAVVNGTTVLTSVHISQSLHIISKFALLQSHQSRRWSGLQQQELPNLQHLERERESERERERERESELVCVCACVCVCV